MVGMRLRGWLAHLLKNFFGKSGVYIHDSHGPIDSLVDGSLDEHSVEYQVVASVLRTCKLTVSDIMVHRADIAAIDESASFESLFDIFCKTGHTRLPVYHGTLDNCVGTVYIKDVLFRKTVMQSPEDFIVKKYVKRGLFVPSSVSVSSLLERMQTSEISFAIAIDEYGGVDGLVTIEDLIKKIIGKVDNVYSVDGQLYWLQETNNIFVCDSRISIDDFEKRACYQLTAQEEDEEIDTLGGLVCMMCGRVPERGEIVKHHDGHEFEIIDASARCIKRLRVTIQREVHKHPDQIGENANNMVP